jgi:crotonobetainyl-CoA:carnitine CoA-transferase CaiB-like acyl-CoA transferase
LKVMRKPLNGIRVLEVAQFTFVPSAGAVLADWGADVVKIEHPVTGDAQRGLVKALGRRCSTSRSWRSAPGQPQFSVNMARLMGGPLPKAERRTQAPGNPLTGAYRTSDGRFVQLSMLQPTRYWPEFCRLMSLHDLASSPRR